MPKEYNFRYESQRRQFWKDLLAQRVKLQRQWEENYGEEEASKMVSGLRQTFDIGNRTQGRIRGRVNADEQGTGNFRGFRTFRDLQDLEPVLFEVSSSGAEFARRATRHHRTTFRLVRFKKRGKRVIGEIVYWTAIIINR